MAEQQAGAQPQAEFDNLFRDTSDLTKAIRYVRDQKVIDLLYQIADGLNVVAGESYHLSSQGLTTVGVLQNLITDVVPVNIERQLSQIIIICRQDGAGFIYADNVLIGSVRTGAANPNASFTFSPRYLAQTGQTIKIDFRSQAGCPISDIECHFQAVDKQI